ncbi:MAG TPA: prenyltransferase [bacterium]|nr:prenyltransferase [bacterium]HPQ65230.1 prenyltransferase [bacterium]
MSAKRRIITGWRVWCRTGRVNFLPAGILPYLLGWAYSFPNPGNGHCRRPWFFAAGLAGTVLAHLSANLFNEYWDYRLGADRAGNGHLPHSGGSGTLPAGLVRPRAVLRAASGCLAAAGMLGLGLTAAGAPPLILLLGGAGGFIAWAYTAPPFSLAYRGWGEISLAVAFGPLLVGGGYALQTGDLAGRIWFVSLIPALLISAVLIVNEIADRENDRAAGKYNLAARMGRTAAARAGAALLGGAYLGTAVGWAAGVFPPASLAALATAPWAAGAGRRVWSIARGGGNYRDASAGTIKTYCLFLAVLAASLVVS